jgi:glutathione reductase (NADPH)
MDWSRGTARRFETHILSASPQLDLPRFIAFTMPPIASVGLSEKQAREQGLKFRVQKQRASDWYAARRVAETIYGFKVLVEDGTDHVLGAHLVGQNVDEVINIFALAMRNGLTAEDLKTTIFAYPTRTSDICYMV